MPSVKLTKLRISEANARHDSEEDVAIATLEASIRELGQLQPLGVVQTGDEEGGEIVFGRRRFIALKRIHGDDPEATAEVTFVPFEQALDASLAENYVRQQMSTKELYNAFRRLVTEGGKTPEQVGEQFGYELPRVKRILALGNLHPELMQAWDEGQFSDSVAHAFADHPDQEVQLRIAKKIRKEFMWGEAAKTGFKFGNGYSNSVRDEVRKALKGKDFDAAKLKYVGIEAYKEAGGTYTETLFGQDTIIHKPEIVEKLAEAKLKAECEEALTRLKRADGSDLNIEWVSRDQLPTINQYGYTEVDSKCYIEPEFEGEGDDGIAVIPAGGKILGHAKIGANGESTYALYWESREAGGIPLPEQKTHKTTAPASTTKSKGVLLKELNGASSRNNFFALQVLFADAVIDGLLVDAKDMVGLTAEVEGLYQLLFVLAWADERNVHIPGFPRFQSPERGPHQVKEALDDKDGGKRRLSTLLPDAAWLDAKTLEDGFKQYWGWISTNNSARLGAALLGRLWSPVVNSFAEHPQPDIVGLVAGHANKGFTDAEWAAQNRERQLKAIELITHKMRMAIMADTWGIEASHLKPLKKATSAGFMQQLITDEGKRKLLGLSASQTAEILDWLPPAMKLPAAEKPKAEAKPKPKAKAKARKEKEPA